MFDPEAFNLEQTQIRLRTVLKPAAVRKERRQAARKEEKQNTTSTRSQSKFACTCGLCNRSTAPAQASAMSSAFSGLGYDIPVISSRGGDFDPSHRQMSNLTHGLGEFMGKDEDGMRCCSYCFDRECPNQPQWKFKRCSRCEQRVYCTRQCQQKDWSRHKELCKKLRVKPPEASSSK